MDATWDKDEHVMPMIEEKVGAENMSFRQSCDAMPDNAFKNVKELFG